MKWDLLTINEGDHITVTCLDGDELNVTVRKVYVEDSADGYEDPGVFIYCNNGATMSLAKKDVQMVSVKGA